MDSTSFQRSVRLSLCIVGSCNSSFLVLLSAQDSGKSLCACGVSSFFS